MLNKMLLSPILTDDNLTRGLGDAEARILVEWLVEQVEGHADDCGEVNLEPWVKRLTHRARSIVRFVGLWCYESDRRGAVQLAGAERFTWPLPDCCLDPCELMQNILTHEAHQLSLEVRC
jgi:hypothetical protein